MGEQSVKKVDLLKQTSKALFMFIALLMVQNCEKASAQLNVAPLAQNMGRGLAIIWAIVASNTLGLATQAMLATVVLLLA